MIEVPKYHLLSHAANGFAVSDYLQELICFAGQEDVYERGRKNLEKYLLLEVDAKQIERISTCYGQQIQPMCEDEQKQMLPDSQLAKYLFYVMIDGSMILTREEKWKEIKLGRIFRADAHLHISGTRKWIRKSLYMSYLGHCQQFLDKLELYTDNLFYKVFICDGAPWIWNWVDANYPKAIQILDFYHAKEHLTKFAKLHFKNEAKRNQWIDIQEILLLEDHVQTVIQTIQSLKCRTVKTKEAQRQLIQYYQNNKKRMMYKTFREKGLLIGSGPIESAHRTVIQRRLKLSGQRWNKANAQAIADLRIVEMNQQWDKLIQLIVKS